MLTLRILRRFSSIASNPVWGQTFVGCAEPASLAARSAYLPGQVALGTSAYIQIAVQKTEVDTNEPHAYLAEWPEREVQKRRAEA